MVLYFFVVLEAGGLEVLLGGFGGRRGCFFEAPRVSWAPFWHLLGASGDHVWRISGLGSALGEMIVWRGEGPITPRTFGTKKCKK